MGKASIKENKSVYQTARESLGLSRAAATELMEQYGMTDYRLVRIEDGSALVHPDDVYAMAKGYNAPHLCNHYCTHECRIGQEYVPEVTIKENVHEILVHMVMSLESLQQKKMRLMEILTDGKIRTDELDDFICIESELEHISMIVEAIQLWCEKQLGENEDLRRSYNEYKSKR